MSFRFTTRFVSRLTRGTLALILAGGRGSRLRDLTNWRVKPAVPFGGKFRRIDFPLSNCIDSGIRQVGVLTGREGGDLRYQISVLSKYGYTYEVVALGGGIDTDARRCLDRFTASFEVWPDP